MFRAASLSGALVGALLVGATDTAQAAAACVGVGEPRLLLADMGRLEAIRSDDEGRLFFTDLDDEVLYRWDAPSKDPVVLARGVTGGLAWSRDGSLLVGYGSSIGSALLGGLTVPLGLGGGKAGIFRIDPDSGERTTVAHGLSMANGLVETPEGAIYATNFLGGYVERIFEGRVDPRWAFVPSANGIVYDGGNHLYVSQSVSSGTVARVDVRSRRVSLSSAAPLGLDSLSGPDGLARDPAGRLYVGGHIDGKVTRVDTDGVYCTLATGLGAPPLGGVADLAFGNGSGGFSSTSLFVATWSGKLWEIPDAQLAAGR